MHLETAEATIREIVKSIWQDKRYAPEERLQALENINNEIRQYIGTLKTDITPPDTLGVSVEDGLRVIDIHGA